MKIFARKGELITDLLFKQTGQDSDQLETAFYRLNPHVRGDAFTADTHVHIPEISTVKPTQSVTRSWD
ncbi:Phage tail protein [Vibrio crassostreae]|jgi:hypothetical protein|uniref:hypothetical protein n=1 Tax=Vibrio TaxID=662 RepID=UPI000632B464|nr:MULTISPECIES: hypothetical protein [Vibrio]MDL5028620.1 hypothetical protein [Vibrio sp. TMPB1044]MDN5208748.1 hypothetical protein [Vibrio sp. TMPB1044]CAK1693665.1 Phage tail protein [Vibrio crassostreae]CAK1694172.1 Phage tail protein [Vibrio crassostreae]CAK1695664.1 Phage tail protein [Vibrio crassostreae]